MTPDDFKRAEDLLSEPDAEDCERFASWYGRSLLDTARAFGPLLEAARALGAMPEGYCFCSSNRIGDDSKAHEPECADLRAALAKAEGRGDGTPKPEDMDPTPSEGSPS